jgi:FtsZ-binding cell division protein ZapB
MATAAAITMTPIILTSLTFGIYAVTLARDSFTLYQARKKIEATKASIAQISDELSTARENLVGKFTHGLQQDNSIAHDLKRLQIQIDELQKQNINPSTISQISILRHKRNELIHSNETLQEQLRIQYQNDPHIARLSFNHSKLELSLSHQEEAMKASKRKVALSAACMIGIGLLIVPLLFTGVGAIATALVGSIAVGVISIVRIRDHRKKVASHRQKNKHISSNLEKTHCSELANSKRKAVHTSVLQIDNILLAGDKKQIVNTLIQTTPVGLPVQPKEVANQSQRDHKHGTTLQQRETNGEGSIHPQSDHKHHR